MRNLGARGCGGGNPAWYAKKCEQIEELLAKGLSYKEIANKLKIELAFVMQLAKSRRIMKPVTMFDNGSDIYVIIDDNSNNIKEEEEMKKNMRKKVTAASKIKEVKEKSMEEIALEDDAVKDVPVVTEQPIAEKPVITTEAIDKNDSFSDFQKLFGIDLINNLNSLKQDGVVECGLIGDRHDMPVDRFIFQRSLESNELFDYNFQEKVIKDFIIENIPKVLIVYTTGLQMVLASLIKVCISVGTPLILKHYNSDTMKYVEQNINAPVDFKYFGNSKMARNLSNRYNQGMFFYKSNIEDYCNNEAKTCYAFTLATEDDNDIIIDRVGVLCKNFSDIWEVYPTFIEKINENKDRRLAVFVAIGNIDSNNNFSFGNSITKGYNFK